MGNVLLCHQKVQGHIGGDYSDDVKGNFINEGKVSLPSVKYTATGNDDPGKDAPDQEALKLIQPSTDPPPPGALFWKLWDANLETAQKALHTEYIQGIKHGNLDPVTFGSAMVNDAYYCFRGRETYSIAAQRDNVYNDKTLNGYLQSKAESYTRYNEEFRKTWHLKSAESITPNKVTFEYAGYEREIATTEEPIYTLIVNLPCQYLWAWLAKQLNEDPEKLEQNMYDFWIQGNKKPSGAYKIGNFINNYMEKHPGAVDEDKAMEIYTKAMIYELQHFEANCE